MKFLKRLFGLETKTEKTLRKADSLRKASTRYTKKRTRNGQVREVLAEIAAGAE